MLTIWTIFATLLVGVGVGMFVILVLIGLKYEDLKKEIVLEVERLMIEQFRQYNNCTVEEALNALHIKPRV